MGGDTNNSLWNNIGHHFQDVLMDQFPEFETHSLSNAPDFKVDGFWAEAKAGRYDKGPRIHSFQCKSFPSLSEPTIYVLGYHNLVDSQKKIKQKTDLGRMNFLRRNMSFKWIYFISGEIIKRIWENDKQTSKKDKLDYLTLHNSIPLNLIRDRTFRRSGEKCTSENYYGFNRTDFLYSEPIPQEETKIQFDCGYFIKKSEERIVNFLRKYDIIK